MRQFSSKSSFAQYVPKRNTVPPLLSLNSEAYFENPKEYVQRGSGFCCNSGIPYNYGDLDNKDDGMSGRASNLEIPIYIGVLTTQGIYNLRARNPNPKP